MVFPLDYLAKESRHVVRKRGIFSTALGSGNVPEEKRKPVVVFQVWDNDMFSADDFLGEFRLDMTAMPIPAKSAEKCRLEILPEIKRRIKEEEEKRRKREESVKDGTERKSFWRKCFPFVGSSSSYSLLRDERHSGDNDRDPKLLDLFKQKRIKGFYPFVAECRDGVRDRVGGSGGQVELAGKLEVELEVLTSSEASLRPAGRGREDPNANPRLDPPKRPETSFLWIASPWKSLRHVVWKKFRGYILKALIIVLVAIFIFLLFYTLPETINKKIWGVS